MTPLVSIIIPSYNHSAYIVETLDSVKADSYQNKEIIIIDDGSKDQSPVIIEKWIQNNKDITVKFLSRENKGVCQTLNELVSKSSGKYVLVLASDDYLVNDTIAERVDILEKNPQKLVLVSDAEVVNKKGEIICKSSIVDFHKKNKNNYTSDDKILDEILFNFAISGAVVLINREIYNLIGQYPENLKGEDFYFYSHAVILNKILFFDKIVSGYRIHDTNTSGNQNPELLKDGMKIYLMIINKVPGFKRKLRILKNILWIMKYVSLNKKMRNYFLKKLRTSS